MPSNKRKPEYNKVKMAEYSAEMSQNRVTIYLRVSLEEIKKLKGVKGEQYEEPAEIGHNRGRTETTEQFTKSQIKIR